MRTKTFEAAALLLAVLFCRPAEAQPPTAASVLAEMKAATGGAAWDRVTTLHVVSAVKGGGLTGTQDEWDDVPTGRYSVSSVLGPAAERDGYDGTQAWSQDASGETRIVAAADDAATAQSAAYRDSLAYWFPARRPGTVSYFKHAEEKGRGFDVVQLAPTGGLPFQFWIDDRTHLLDRIVQTGAQQTDTTFLSDYRAFGGLILPFGVRETTGDTRYDTLGRVQLFALNTPVPAGTFAIPPPPPPDFTLAGDAALVTVPFRYEGDHILVDVRINGQGPFAAILDTGGLYVATPALARRVGLKVQGAVAGTGNGPATVDTGLARAQTVSLGGLTLRRPLFYVIDLPALRDRPIIGYELFKRLTVRIDYDKHLLTLTLPSRFAYAGSGVSVPFRFNDRIPEVDGNVDGVTGAFTIDTGAGDSVRLNRPFVEAHHLLSRYKPRSNTIIGYGVGGAQRGSIVRLGRLALGGVGVNRVQATLTTDQAGGGADKAVAGNVGEGFLHRFNLTFDYARMRIIFEPNSHYAEPEREDRSGLTFDPNASTLLVADVIPGSPAAQAGIEVGDVVETVNGEVLASDTLSHRSPVFTKPAGTRLRLRVRTGQTSRTVTLTLRDLF